MGTDRFLKWLNSKVQRANMVEGYTLTKEQYARKRAIYEEHRSPSITICFTSTGIGDKIEFEYRDTDGNKVREDVTDYENW